jgi:predicted O-methyltransferase YrrM
VTIAYHWYRADGELYEWEGMRTRLPLTTRPGETVHLIAPLQAPWRVGSYRLRWDALVPLVSWFSDHALEAAEIEIDVTRAPDDPAYVDDVSEFLEASTKIPGWFRGDEAKALVVASYGLPENAVIVEIGSFLGSGSVLLAGARKVRGSGKVHCIDPFDCSGDGFSAPIYQDILTTSGVGTLKERFDENIRRFGLDAWVEGHASGAVDAAATWTTPIDLLILDGDQSYRGAREAFEKWTPFLKPGGILAVHNTAPRIYAPDHDGNRRLALEEVLPPRYLEPRLVGSTTFARKAPLER